MGLPAQYRTEDETGVIDRVKALNDKRRAPRVSEAALQGIEDARMCTDAAAMDKPGRGADGVSGQSGEPDEQGRKGRREHAEEAQNQGDCADHAR